MMEEMTPSEAAPEDNPILAFSAPDADEQDRMIEAILFASREPLSTDEIEQRMPKGSDAAEALRRVEAAFEGRGVNVVRVAGKWSLRTASDLSFLLREEAQETRKLSRAATETLAIIGYHQPVTRTEIEEIRGVAVSKGTLDLLMDLEWIKLGRRRETPGRPVTFVTTELFLSHFGLESVKDLPGVDELKNAGLLDSRTVAIAPQTDDDDILEADDEDGPGEEPNLFN